MDGRNYRPKHVELFGIINKPLLLYLVGCLYYCISDVWSYKHQEVDICVATDQNKTSPDIYSGESQYQMISSVSLRVITEMEHWEGWTETSPLPLISFTS